MARRMSTLGKLTIGLLALILLVAGGAIAAVMMRPGYFAASTPTPSSNESAAPIPAPAPEAEVNPFGAAATNPFDDTETANPFATPEPDGQYVNPFADL